MSKQPVRETARDRSGLGLPPKSERRALGKAAAAQRARAKRRKQLLHRVGTSAAIVVTVLAVVGGIAALAGAFDSDTPPQTSASATPSLDPLATAEKPTVTAGGAEPPTKLNVTTLIEGTGPAVQNGQTVQVNYVGTFYADGKEFDSSYGEQPFSFTVGGGGVIRGWDEGVVGAKVGSRIQLDIPADMAYGASPEAGRPAGALRFVVDVLSAVGP